MIKKVVKSQTEPPTNCIWIKDNSLYQYTNGKWVKFGQSQEDQIKDLQIDNNLHNEFFEAYYKTHPEEIVNLPKETIYKYFPDILMIIEPLNGSVVVPSDGYWYGKLDPYNLVTVTTTNGVITVDMVKKAYDELGVEYPDPESQDTWTASSRWRVNTYNCSAIRYCNMQKCWFKPSTTEWGSKIEPDNKLKIVEGLVGWETLTYEYFLSFVQPNYWSSGTQLWWDNEKITFKGDWLLQYSKIPENHEAYWDRLKYFMNIQKDRTLDRLIEFDGTMYIGNNISMGYQQVVNIGWDWTSGLCFTFVNFKSYQYPTIDLTRYKETPNLDKNHYGIKKGQMLHRFIDTQGSFTWIPERPQKCLIKGMGPLTTYNAQISLNGIIDWDYDDMIASLITYAHNYRKDYIPGTRPNKYLLSQTSYDKLTKDDLAAIVAMGNSVSVKV